MSKFGNGEEYTSDPVYGIYLADGSLLIIYFEDFNPEGNLYSIRKMPNTKALGGKFDTSIIQFVYIDVNGNKPPNIAGRDLFNFVLAEDGHLYPSGGKDDAIFFSQKSITDTSNNCYWKNSNDCSSSGSGNQCAGRIIESGWKMDY